jgi:hypothetical protein
MAKDILRAFDPSRLMREAGLEPDAWQRQLLIERPKRALLNCSRQSGKTEAAITLVEHTALYEPGSLSLIVSPSQRQSGEVFRRLMLLHSSLADVPHLVAESALRAVYANGSRVIALPGSERTVRGYAGARLIVLDEAARIDDELMAALRPMMATVDGSLIMLSTPFGRRGEFFRAWSQGEGWTRVRVPASECPRLSPEFLAEERRELGAMRFAEEYCLEFLEADESVFPTHIIERAFTQEVRALWA